jgi:hypothetical protein
MNNYLKCQLVMLPDNQKVTIATGIYMTSNDKLGYQPSGYELGILPKITGNKDELVPQHLYIISDREIKEGDWCIRDNRVFRVIRPEGYRDGKKIEATTDYLIMPINREEDGNVPCIPESFIQSYIKNYNLDTPIKEAYLEIEYAKWMQGHKGCGCMEGFQELCSNNFEKDGHEYCKLAFNIKVRSEGNKAGCVLCHQIKDRFTRQEVLGILSLFNNRLLNMSDEAIGIYLNNKEYLEWFYKNY